MLFMMKRGRSKRRGGIEIGRDAAAFFSDLNFRFLLMHYISHTNTIQTKNKKGSQNTTNYTIFLTAKLKRQLQIEEQRNPLMGIFEGGKGKKLYFYLLCFFVGKFLRLWKWDGCESSLLKRRGKDCCIYYRVDGFR